jgi:hypothetical protein
LSFGKPSFELLERGRGEDLASESGRGVLVMRGDLDELVLGDGVGTMGGLCWTGWTGVGLGRRVGRVPEHVLGGHGAGDDECFCADTWDLVRPGPGSESETSLRSLDGSVKHTMRGVAQEVDEEVERWIPRLWSRW